MGIACQVEHVIEILLVYASVIISRHSNYNLFYVLFFVRKMRRCHRRLNYAHCMRLLCVFDWLILMPSTHWTLRTLRTTDYTRKIRGHEKFGYVNDVERHFYLAFIVQLQVQNHCVRARTYLAVRSHRATVWNSNWQLVTDLKQFIRFIKKHHIKIDDDVTTPAISKSFFFHWNCSFYPLWSIIFIFFLFSRFAQA